MSWSSDAKEVVRDVVSAVEPEGWDTLFEMRSVRSRFGTRETLV